LGEPVKSIEVDKASQNTRYTINVSDLSKGIYFLEITRGNVQCVKRFVK
jgi:hypothetical protein